MAFHQTTRQLAQRVPRVDTTSVDTQRQANAAPLSQSNDVRESQTWVLFSPATDAGTTTSYLSSVADEQPTPGRSRIGDLGSLNTLARSEQAYTEPANSDALDEDDVIEDDAELDSLDSHLPEFRTLPSPFSQGQHAFAQSTPILPAHDGLGSFRFDTQGLASEMQEQMYQFERFNPRRVKRRRESLELGQLELENEEAQEAVRTRRIEEWRLEQSRILLEEIQKETRRRRDSTVSAFTNKLRRTSQASTNAEAEEATLSTVGEATPDTSMAGTEWHDQDEPNLAFGEGDADEVGLWSRITRKVIRDLMGVDDRLLCVLFGEALPEDLGLDDDDDLSTTPKASVLPSAEAILRTEAESFHDSTWQVRVLDRIARELGVLVSQLSAHPHPGAFSTFVHMQQMPLPYAGLPVIPEAPPAAAVASADAKLDAKNTNTNVEESTPTMAQFQPTVRAIGQTQPMAIPGAKSTDGPAHVTAATLISADTTAPHTTFTQQEWEQDLDIKLIFRYLRNRFTSSRTATPSGPSHSHHPGGISAQDTAAKAARVRQHHPLVGVRARHGQTDRRTFKVTVPGSSPAQLHARHASSCASQSTRRSQRRGSVSVSSRHSSRHYWDIGGSIGTGSMVASTGPMGSWGEV